MWNGVVVLLGTMAVVVGCSQSRELVLLSIVVQMMPTAAAVAASVAVAVVPHQCCSCIISALPQFNKKHQYFLRQTALRVPRSFIDPSRPMDEDELALEALSNGLYELQLIVVCLAAVCSRSRKVLERCEMQLKMNGTSIPQLRVILHGFADSLGDGEVCSLPVSFVAVCCVVCSASLEQLRTKRGGGAPSPNPLFGTQTFGSQTPFPPFSRPPSLCPATVPLTPSTSDNGICNRQKPPPTASATSSNRLFNRLWGPSDSPSLVMHP